MRKRREEREMTVRKESEKRDRKSGSENGERLERKEFTSIFESIMFFPGATRPNAF